MANREEAILSNTQRIPAGPATEATSQAILAAIGGSGVNFADDHSVTSTVERDGVVTFAMLVTDLSTGPIPVADIDLTGVSAVLSKSTGGGAFSSVGITQPVFTKVNGRAYVDYRFLAAEWAIGDNYRLVMSGLASHVGLAVYYSHDILWSGTIMGNAATQTGLAANLAAITTTDGDVLSVLAKTDVATSTRAAPGAAMTLTAGEETAVQAKILSDATPFPGADVPAIKTNTDTLPHMYQQKPSVPMNINAIVAGETDFLNLSTAGHHYDLEHMRLKAADPGANIVIVRLYELVNNVPTLIDTYNITGSLDPVEQTYTLYLNLMDMFGMPDVQGDNLRITVQASAGGPYAVTGQYEYAEAT